MLKPGGTRPTSSPWLAHTRNSSGTPANSRGRRAAAADLHVRVAELALARSAHFAAEQVGHQLHAVADAEHRQRPGRRARRRTSARPVRDALRPARQDDARRGFAPKLLERRVERHDLGVDRQLAQASRDELGVLRAEIENDDGLMRHVGKASGLGPQGSELPLRRGIIPQHIVARVGRTYALLLFLVLGFCPHDAVGAQRTKKLEPAITPFCRPTSLDGLTAVSTIRRRCDG